MAKTLTDDEIINYATAWARKLQSRRFPFQELFNEGYVAGHEGRNIQQAIRDYIRSFNRYYLEIVDDIACVPDCHKDLIGTDEVNTIIQSCPFVNEPKSNRQNCVLAGKGLDLLYDHFVDGLTFAQLSKKYGAKPQTIHVKVSIVLEQLRRAWRQFKHENS